VRRFSPLTAAVCAALSALLIALPARGQDAAPLAAALKIIFDGVEVRRANTDGWFPMRAGAQMAFGIGDSLRTDLSGRAWIEFDGARALVLPASIFTIRDYPSTGIVDVEVSGRAIHEIAEDGIVYRVFEPMTAGLNVRADAPALFATQARPYRRISLLEPLNRGQPSLIAVAAAAERPLEIGSSGAVERQFGAGEGVFSLISGAPSPPQRLTGLLHFVEVEILNTPVSCAAVARPTVAPRLVARIGPAEQYRSLGAIDFGVPLRIVGRTEDGLRYRIAYYSAYAWVVANGVALDPGCDPTALPVFSYETVELPLGVIAVTPEELPLLQPFYGTPTDDPWFYRAENDLNPIR
jgi:uncharacterized protein YraI